MRLLYHQAIAQTLDFPGPDVQFTTSVTNKLPIPVLMSWVNADNRLRGTQTIPPGKTRSFVNTWNGLKLVLNNALSGSFCAVFECSDTKTTQVLEIEDLTAPNRIGPVPQPSAEMMIPTDTPRITVGVNELPNGNFIVREQYWQRMPDSYTLVPGEEETVSITTTSGKQTTSSTSTEVGASSGLSASAGWGPVSSSISASLSANASTFQQVTVNEQTQSYRSKTLKNESESVQMYLIWQLTDVVTIFAPDTGEALTAVIGVEAPSIVGGPYDPTNLPTTPGSNVVLPEGFQLPAPVEAS